MTSSRPRRTTDRSPEEAGAFLVHVNPKKGWSYEKGFDPRDPFGCASFLLASAGPHGWSAGNCWRMMREGDVLLFKTPAGRRREPAGVYFAGRIVRSPFESSVGRRLKYVVDAQLTKRLVADPILLPQLGKFAPRSQGAAIQALKGDWKQLVKPGSAIPVLPRPTPGRLRLASRSVTVARRLARDQFFSRAVRSLAGGRCAVCPSKFDYRFADILEVAHIRPVAARGPDHPRNSLVLCPNHHAMFDEGLWSLSDNGEVVRSSRLSPALAAQLASRIPEHWDLDAACVRWHRNRMQH